MISSIGAVTGKISTGQVPIMPTIIMVAASLLASPLGANAGKRVNINPGHCSEDVDGNFMIKRAN